MRGRKIAMQIWALTTKDFTIWSSYKSLVVTSLLSVAFGLFSWAILGNYGNQPVPFYNTNFVSFLIVGILVSGFVLPLAQGMSSRLNPWTFETVLMTGIRKSVFVVGSLLWQIIFSGVTLIPQILLAIYLFKVSFLVNIESIILAVLLTMVIVCSLAMMDMGIRVVTKQGDPIMWGLIVIQGVASGMVYPIQELNKYVPGISTLSWAIPFTWVYHLIRISVLEGRSLLDPNVALSFAEGVAYCAILVPICYFVMAWGLKRAKKDGTMGWY